jgi:hypothetical protein
MQLTIKKDILDIKLRDGPLTNRAHNKKSEPWSYEQQEQTCHHDHDHAPIENHEQQDKLYNAQENHHSGS